MRVRELASSHKKQALIHRLPGAHGRAVSVLVSVSTSILILIIIILPATETGNWLYCAAVPFCTQ